MTDGPVITDWLAVGTGIVAFFAAIYFAYRQTSILEKQANIQKLQIDIAKQQLVIIENQEQERSREKRKANLVARIEPKEGQNSVQHFIVIKNDGPADARNITLFLDGRPISKHRNIRSSLKEIVQQISVGSNVSYRLIMRGGDSGILNLEMKWEDDSNEVRRAQTVLNVF